MLIDSIIAIFFGLIKVGVIVVILYFVVKKAAKDALSEMEKESSSDL